MGMPRVIIMKLRCERCRGKHQAEVQFKAGRDRGEWYTAGDRVDDLPAGEAWEGLADRFCPACFAMFRAERERAMATLLAVMVRGGQLALKLRNAEAPLTPDEILARGESEAEAARESSSFGSHTQMLDGLCHLDSGGVWSSRLPDSWWRDILDALSEEMRARGWPYGDDPWREDLQIRLDVDRRIWVNLVSA